MEVELKPLQVHNILQFAGKHVTKLLNKVLETIGKKGTKVITEYDEITSNTPINAYDVVRKSVLFSVLEKKGIDEKDLAFLKQYALTLKVWKGIPSEIDFKGMYLETQVTDNLIKDLGKKPTEVNEKVSVIICAIIQIIAREVAPQVLACFDLIKQRNPNVISSVIDKKLNVNDLLLTIEGKSSDDKLLLYFVINIGDKKYDSFVLGFKITEEKRKEQ